jgi:TAG lipase/lysophosphatidylethanolamine acyltransferase
MAAAQELDHLLRNEMWRIYAVDAVEKRGRWELKYYDCTLIEDRTNAFEDAVFPLASSGRSPDIMVIQNLLRAGFTRNIGGILNPKLYAKANAGTKLQIETYVECVSAAVKYYVEYPITDSVPLTQQDKLGLLINRRMAYGRTVLVLQGGSIFGLCHLGVVKAMYQRTLLPRIIAGTGTGALMAAWVCVHTDEQLLRILSGDRIDLSAFVASSQRAAAETQGAGVWLWLRTLYRRALRFLRVGLVLDPQVLEEAVRANVGDMTFKEAYNLTDRILNITVSPSGPGSITLLNHLTAPHVLIWSAALVSNANDRSRTPHRLMCKDSTGQVVRYENFTSSNAPYRSNPITPQESPLSRLGELFNVNHFVISQARPYIAPFLYPTLRIFKTSFSAFFTRWILQECQLRLRQLDILGVLNPGIKRLLMDEIVPGPSLTLVPEIRLSDWARLLRNPTKAEIDHWIERGERSVWPNVVQLWVRLGVEIEMEIGYQRIRRHPEGDVKSDDTPVPKPVRRRGNERERITAIARSG